MTDPKTLVAIFWWVVLVYGTCLSLLAMYPDEITDWIGRKRGRKSKRARR